LLCSLNLGSSIIPQEQDRLKNIGKNDNLAYAVAMPIYLKHETLFSKNLGSICRELLARRRYPHQAAIAKALGIDPPRLSNLLANNIPVGARTVALICVGLDRAAAAQLLQAYLLDEVAKVSRFATEIGIPVWGKDSLVEVLKAEE
jgi:hypothetical protein